MSIKKARKVGIFVIQENFDLPYKNGKGKTVSGINEDAQTAILDLKVGDGFKVDFKNIAHRTTLNSKYAWARERVTKAVKTKSLIKNYICGYFNDKDNKPIAIGIKRIA